MPKIIKVRCNGQNKCINEVDLEAVVKDGNVNIYRIATSAKQPRIRDRYVLRCKHCSEGQVIITRKMIEENLKRD